jgi:hypothetical protein
MHHLNVLGVDSSEVNTASADQRKQRLEKHWQGLVQKSQNPEKRGRRRRQQNQTQESSKPTQISNYIPITEFITDKTDLMQLVCDHFPFEEGSQPAGDGGNFMFTGLHTCGNLGANIMRLFTANSDLSVLCNVGCCYHLLEEDFIRNPHLQPGKLCAMLVEIYEYGM